MDLQVYHHAPKNHCGFLMLFLFHVAGYGYIVQNSNSIRPSHDFHETAAAVSPLFFPTFLDFQCVDPNIMGNTPFVLSLEHASNPQATARTPEDHSTVRYDVKQKCASGAQQTKQHVKMGISAYLSTGKTLLCISDGKG